MSDLTDFTKMLDAIATVPSTEDTSVPLIDPAMFVQTVETRRSVRQFIDRPVEPELVHKLIDLAMLAPSSSNLQPWEFHWVRSPQIKKELVRACLSQPAARSAQELIVIVARTNTWRRNIKEMVRQLDSSPGVPKSVYGYYQQIVPLALSTGPLALLSLAKWVFTRLVRYKRPTPQEPIWYSDLRIWSHKSVALAAQTFMLAARAHNLDTCPMEGFDSWRVKKMLKLPRDAEISMVVSLGYAKPGGVYGPRVRFDRNLFVFEH